MSTYLFRLIRHSYFAAYGSLVVDASYMVWKIFLLRLKATYCGGFFSLERYCKYNVLRLSHYFLQLKAMIYWHQWASIAAWFVLCMNKTYKKIKSEFKNYMIICLVIIYLFIYEVTMFSGFYSNQFFTTHEGENFPLANIRRQCVNWCAVKMQLHLTLY